MTIQFVTLWVGESLGPVERACLRSMARHGQVALYCYSRPDGVPEEVELRDAAVVLPIERVPQKWMHRADLYSDWFRYELLSRGLGTWVDTDIYVVGPIDAEKPYLFGLEAPDIINNAVLRVPPDSPLLPGFLDPFINHRTPSWMPWRNYLPAKARELITGKADLSRIPWGTTSPLALTALARKFGLTHLAEPQERFYPMPWQRADWIIDPNIPVESVITNGTVAIHLWNRCIAAFKNDPAPAGSFLHRLHEEAR